MEQLEKSGLVLEGGGMRGIYTAGVLDVFLENGIGFDGVIGVSAGVVHGCSYLSGQKGRSIRYYKRYCKDWRFMSIRNLLLTGDMVGIKFCYHDLPDRLEPYDYEAFKRSKTEFYATCSNVVTGKPEYLRMTDMKEQVDIMRAFRRMGFRRNVVVLTRQEGYVKAPEKRIMGTMARVRYLRYPRFVRALERRHLVYNKTIQYIRRLEKAGEVFVICPSRKLEIGRMEHSPQKLETTYELGQRDAKACLDRLIKWQAMGRD